MFRQWYALLKNREEISVMMWTADGSELLDYSGNLSDSFEWCRFIGNANKPLAEKGEDTLISLHSKKRLYTENPPIMTYKILKTIVAAFKEEGKRLFPDAEITVIETFDIGPEFAVSDFKYNRHPEVCSHRDFVGGFVDSTAVLNGDSRRYASFPDGIPDKTPFGYFLGRQANVFLRDMGFDGIWLSNGMGFSANPWSQDGKIYDGEKFYPQRLQNVKDEVREFWRLFRSGCPNYTVETRGTNNSVGIDYATDGVPLSDIYNGGFNIVPPPNSPWAALNDNFGLELMGHMTRICNLPNDRFMFRYYIHDPWWYNSPWYDRYNECPHDIYLPMAISRIDEDGEMQSAEILNILTVDNSFGDMPDCCVNEPLPHLLKAERNESDEPAPFVWVYPMREYTSADSDRELKEMYFGDKFICDAINSGFPLNCIVSTDNFQKHTEKLYNKSILVSPVPFDKAVEQRLVSMAQSGIGIIVYGGAEYSKEWNGRDNIRFIDTASDPSEMLRAAETFGYYIEHIRHDKNAPEFKVPTMTVARHNNGMYFSVYNTNTTTETRIHFPLGAPVMMCGETEIKDGCAVYRFARWEHKECRIFVEQKSGVVGVRELTPGCMKNRRRFKVSGLEDATVCYFAEEYCKDRAEAGPYDWRVTQVADDRWRIVNDERFGTYLKAEHISGEICFYMPSRIDW